MHYELVKIKFLLKACIFSTMLHNIIKLPFVATYSSSSGSWFDIREGCNSLLILSQLVSKLFSSCLKYYTQILYQNTARRAGGYIERQNEQ
jgi:hypothetical protein